MLGILVPEMSLMHPDIGKNVKRGTGMVLFCFKRRKRRTAATAIMKIPEETNRIQIFFVEQRHHDIFRYVVETPRLTYEQQEAAQKNDKK